MLFADLLSDLVGDVLADMAKPVQLFLADHSSLLFPPFGTRGNSSTTQLDHFAACFLPSLLLVAGQAILANVDSSLEVLIDVIGS